MSSDAAASRGHEAVSTLGERMKARSTARKHGYARESEMCEQLCAHARALGFVVYAETAGFDLLMVAGPNVRGFSPGDQLGIEAKLLPNMRVLAQSLPRGSMRPGPHYYAVLIPRADEDFKLIAHALKISVLEASSFAGPDTRVRLDRIVWHRQSPEETCWVPDCEVPGMAAGIAAPKQLTKWKLSAIKLCLLGERRGFLTKSDFLDHEVSMTRFREKQWIKAAGVVTERGRQVQRYALVNEKRPPHLLYPDVVAALRDISR